MSHVLKKNVWTLIVYSSVSLLSGCFDSGDSEEVVANDPLANPPPAAENHAPTITGMPNSTAIVGSSWEFMPSTADSDGDTLSFDILNRPVWASFDNKTGGLSGIPLLGHEGRYAGVKITVSDGRKSASLADFTLTVQSSTTNNAPEIGGNAPRTAVVGQRYIFQPNASDGDGDKLTFSIANRPIWASFNVATGILSGTPVQGNEAVYDNIVVSVSDGELMASMPAFAIAVTQAASGSVTLTWTPPTMNTDGTLLSNLAAYKIYYGLTEGDYPNEILIDNPGITTYVVDNLSPNAYYFVSTSINSGGTESDYSNVLLKNVTAN